MSIRRPVTLAVAAIVLLASGSGISFVLTDQLGIRSTPVAVPAEKLVAAPERAPSTNPRFTRVDAPDSPRIAAAVDELTAAGGFVPTSAGDATLTVTVTGTGPDAVKDDESYSLSGDVSALVITAVTDAGAARGVYDLAADLRRGTPLTSEVGTTVASALRFRMADLGAAGVEPDAAQWLPGTNYSHASGAFENAILPGAPYLDPAAIATDTTSFEEYARHVVAQGFTAIAVPGLIEYLTFDAAGVYAGNPDYVARATAMRDAFRPMFAYAHQLGLQVYLRTDMLTLSTPLETYLTKRFGSLDTENPALWKVYTDAIDELYAAVPEIDGLVLRVGEAGAIYDTPGWDYYSTLDVTTVASVRAMLTALSHQGEKTDRDVIFRTWSVGVGAVGDMHTNPASYHAVLDGLDSPNLVVSTKYTLGDFYSHLPLNGTLDTGSQRRIIEFQSRREFEGFGGFPNDLSVLYQQAIQRFLASNPHIEGIWVWTQDGGPWRAGPMSLELTSGFWQLYELNTELAVRLARDPSADPAELTADWAARWLSSDPTTVAAIGSAMTSSRAAITEGLYIGPYADKKVSAIGLEPPPMMWLFEWDILTGDSAVLDVISSISMSQMNAAIAEGPHALAAVRTMKTAVAATDPASWKPGMRAAFLASLDDEKSEFTVLAAYREYFLRFAQWHDTGSPAAYSASMAALHRYQAAAAAHLARYAKDVQHPPLNLTAADLGVSRAQRDLPMAWSARLMFALLLFWVAFGIAARNPRIRRVPGAKAAAAMLTAATTPWRAGTAVAQLGRIDRVLLIGVPVVTLVLSRGILTWFEAPAHALVMLAAWALFTVVALFAARGSRRLAAAIWPVIATLGGVALLRTILLLAVLTPTGPGGYWYGFWTDPVRRSLYVTVAFALLLWLVVAVAWTLATQLGARRALGVALVGVGIVIGAMAAFVGLVGLEQALTVWNDQMGLLPWGLSRILGITVYLGIPASSAWYAAAFGGVLLLAGLAFALPRTRTRRRLRRVAV